MPKSASHMIVGSLIGHRDGFGFLRPDDGSDDIFVPNREMLKAMHGDQVSARITRTDSKGRSEAQIIEVVKHANFNLVGRLVLERGIYLVIPEDNRIKHDVVIDSKELGQAKPGEVVTAEITHQPTRDTPPIGKITEIIGKIDDPGIEVEIALRKFRIPNKFSKLVINKSKKISTEISANEIKKRIDLRDLKFLTIDGEDARDFDDAIYVEKVNKNSWRLLVAIADVSHYVKSGDVIDIEALNRSTSVYFPRKVIPMLPEILSNEICSLKPNEDKLVMICDMVVSNSGRVRAYQFYEAIISSYFRLTYTEAWNLISKEQQNKTKSNELSTLLLCSFDLLQKFLNHRNQRGSIDFEVTETDIKINQEGRIEKIVPKIRNHAHRIIEEFMIAANSCAADFLRRQKTTFLSRIHESPKEEKIKILREYLKLHGINLEGENSPSANNFSSLLHETKKRSDFEILQNLVLRTMQQAKYCPTNVGHFALSLKNYTHFTSPIRRYPDLLVHRSIKAILKGKKYTPFFNDLQKTHSDNFLNDWHKIGDHCSMAERRAEDASRDVIAWLKCEFMKNKEGEQFEGVVTGVAPFGIFITLDRLYIEGLLHISELGVEYFQHNQITHELRGERTGRKFKLYDRLQVQVLKIDLNGRRVEFCLAQKIFNKISIKQNIPDLTPNSKLSKARINNDRRFVLNKESKFDDDVNKSFRSNKGDNSYSASKTISRKVNKRKKNKSAKKQSTKKNSLL